MRHCGEVSPPSTHPRHDTSHTHQPQEKLKQPQLKESAPFRASSPQKKCGIGVIQQDRTRFDVSSRSKVANKGNRQNVTSTIEVREADILGFGDNMSDIVPNRQYRGMAAKTGNRS